MDLAPSPLQDEFRAELRGWLAEAGPVAGSDRGEELTDQVAALRDWQRRLAAGRWVGVTWPEQYGGRGLGPIEHYIVQEELARARSPELVGRIGVNLVGPTLLEHGTAEQQDRWCPRILDASELWCQLFSEPGAGSDLASLTTRAERDGERWRVTGAKVWTSYAQFADWGLCLARTTPDGPASKGITAFAIDMHAPGVTVRPLRQLTGEAEFNEVFLDGVVVPAERRVGPLDGGWRVARSTLSVERGTNPRQLVIHAQAVDELFRLAAERSSYDDPRLVQRLAAGYVGVRLFQLHSWRALSRLAAGEAVGAEGSVVKVHWSQASQRLHETALRVLGDAAPLWAGAAGNPGDGRWQRSWLYYLGSSIWAGTNEIQRTIIGERVLGLPAEEAQR